MESVCKGRNNDENSTEAAETLLAPASWLVRTMITHWPHTCVVGRLSPTWACVFKLFTSEVTAEAGYHGGVRPCSG